MADTLLSSYPELTLTHVLGHTSGNLVGKVAVADLGGTMVLASDTPPVGADANSLWFETDTGALYVYYGSAWVMVDSGGGVGDVVGPASSTDDHIAVFDSITGKLIKDSGVDIASIGGGGTPGGSAGSIQYNNTTFGGFGYYDNTAGVLRLGNGAVPQGLQVFNKVSTIATPTDYEVFQMTFAVASNVALLHSSAVGSAIKRDMQVFADGGHITINSGDGKNINFGDGFTATLFIFDFENDGTFPSSQRNLIRPASDGGMGFGHPAVRIGDIYRTGIARTSGAFAKTSDAALANVTGLSVPVIAGRTYKFEAILPTTSNVAGGVQFAIGGTCGAGSIVYDALVFDAAAVATSRTTTKGSAVGAVTAVTAALCRIIGTITVSTAGTLTVQFAQNVSNGAASTVLEGASFITDTIA